MASFTLNSPRFPSGTTVSVFVDDRNPILRGQPRGDLVATATVSGTSCTFTGLSADTRYIAYAVVSGGDRFVRFGTYNSDEDDTAGPVYVEYDGELWPTRPSTGRTAVWIGPASAGVPAGLLEGDFLWQVID